LGVDAGTLTPNPLSLFLPESEEGEGARSLPPLTPPSVTNQTEGGGQRGGGNDERRNDGVGGVRRVGSFRMGGEDVSCRF